MPTAWSNANQQTSGKGHSGSAPPSRPRSANKAADQPKSDTVQSLESLLEKFISTVGRRKKDPKAGCFCQGILMYYSDGRKILIPPKLRSTRYQHTFPTVNLAVSFSAVSIYLTSLAPTVQATSQMIDRHSSSCLNSRTRFLSRSPRR